MLSLRSGLHFASLRFAPVEMTFAAHYGVAGTDCGKNQQSATQRSRILTESLVVEIVATATEVLVEEAPVCREAAPSEVIVIKLQQVVVTLRKHR